MKKVIVCNEPEVKVETICHAEVNDYGVNIFHRKEDWYMLVKLLPHYDWIWKNLNNSTTRYADRNFMSACQAIEHVCGNDGEVYSFDSFAEFVEFYQEEK